MVITTEHLPECLAFYEALGFVVKQSGNRHELHADGFKINVHQKGGELNPHARRPEPGSADFCIITYQNLDDLLDTARANHLEIVYEKSRRTGFHGKMDSIYLRDPDGNLVEISSYAE